MAFKVLQINFNYTVPTAAYQQAVAPLADPIAAISGLRWKTWVINPAHQEAGGIYLFEDESALHAYLAGPIAAGIKSHPALSNFSAKVFDVMLEPSAVTRAPLGQPVPA